MWSNNAVVASAAFMINMAKRWCAWKYESGIRTEIQELKHSDTKNLRLLLAAVYMVKAQQRGLDKTEHDLIQTCS